MAATAPVVAGSQPERSLRATPLRLADGVELVGQVRGSGFHKPPHLACRGDGQMVQLTKLLFTIAALSDGRRDAAAVAQILTHASNRRFSAAQVELLVDKRLRPTGVLARADGTSPPVPKREALMALRHRRSVLPERGVNALAWPLVWLHLPVVVVPVLVAMVGFDVWLFAFHGLGAPLRSALYEPGLLLAVVGSVIVGTAFHELGHASACRYSGARPGRMGVGFYLVYPAFYCEVTDAYRLGRAGRLRTDLGGVYFNAIFALLGGAVYFATGQEAALLTAALQHLVLLQQLLPLMRFDGYYVLSDLTGVPDILSRIKPIFRSLVRGRKREPRVAELKPWVRLTVTAYLLALVPTLLFLFCMMVLSAPRVLATVQDSLGLQLDHFRAATGLSETGVAALGVVALVLPVAAMIFCVWCVVRLVGGGLVRWSRGSVLRRIAVVVVGAAVISAAGYAAGPTGNYEPIRPGERVTFGDGVTKLRDAVLTPVLDTRLDVPGLGLDDEGPPLDENEGPGKRRDGGSGNPPAAPEVRDTPTVSPAGEGTTYPSPTGEPTLPAPAGPTPTPSSMPPAPSSTPAPSGTATPTAPTPSPDSTSITEPAPVTTDVSSDTTLIDPSPTADPTSSAEPPP